MHHLLYLACSICWFFITGVILSKHALDCQLLMLISNYWLQEFQGLAEDCHHWVSKWAENQSRQAEWLHLIIMFGLVDGSLFLEISKLGDSADCNQKSILDPYNSSGEGCLLLRAWDWDILFILEKCRRQKRYVTVYRHKCI